MEHPDFEIDKKWNSDKEKECTALYKKAKTYIWLYTETSKLYTKLNTLFTLIIIVGNYIFGSTGIPALFASDWYGAKYINLFIQIMIILMAVLGTIYKILDFTTKISQSNLLIYRYSSLNMDIKKELAKDRKDRIEYDIFYADIIKEDTELIQELIIVPDYIMKKYEKQFGQPLNISC